MHKFFIEGEFDFWQRIKRRKSFELKIRVNFISLDCFFKLKEFIDDILVLDQVPGAFFQKFASLRRSFKKMMNRFDDGLFVMSKLEKIQTFDLKMLNWLEGVLFVHKSQLILAKTVPTSTFVLQRSDIVFGVAICIAYRFWSWVKLNQTARAWIFAFVARANPTSLLTQHRRLTA